MKITIEEINKFISENPLDEILGYSVAMKSFDFKDYEEFESYYPTLIKDYPDGKTLSYEVSNSIGWIHTLRFYANPIFATGYIITEDEIKLAEETHDGWLSFNSGDADVFPKSMKDEEISANYEYFYNLYKESGYKIL